LSLFQYVTGEEAKACCQYFDKLEFQPSSARALEASLLTKFFSNAIKNEMDKETHKRSSFDDYQKSAPAKKVKIERNRNDGEEPKKSPPSSDNLPPVRYTVALPSIPYRPVK
jgi:hypothetical protein